MWQVDPRDKWSINSENDKRKIKEDYNFYLHMKKVLINNGRSNKLIRQVIEILIDLNYRYNHVYQIPKRR